MNKLLAIVFCVVPLIQGRPTDTCFADYLKSKKLIGNEYGSENPVNSLCLAIVEATKHNVMKNIQENLEEDESYKNASSCVVDSMKKSNIADDLLVVYFLEASADAETPEVQEKTEKIQKKLNEILLDALITCDTDKKFGEVFEELFEKSSSEEETDDKEDYCIRKHLVDNNLFSSKHLKLNVNPKNLDTSEIDCDVLYQKSLRDAENELVKTLAEDSQEEDDEPQDTANYDKCLLEVVRKDNFIDQMLQFDYIKEYELTLASREELRVHFIELMKNLSRKAIKCMI
jgi:hypothetical protein